MSIKLGVVAEEFDLIWLRLCITTIDFALKATVEKKCYNNVGLDITCSSYCILWIELGHSNLV